MGPGAAAAQSQLTCTAAATARSLCPSQKPNSGRSFLSPPASSVCFNNLKLIGNGLSALALLPPSCLLLARLGGNAQGHRQRFNHVQTNLIWFLLISPAAERWCCCCWVGHLSAAEGRKQAPLRHRSATVVPQMASFGSLRALAAASRCDLPTDSAHEPPPQQKACNQLPMHASSAADLAHICC